MEEGSRQLAAVRSTALVFVIERQRGAPHRRQLKGLRALHACHIDAVPL